jgi:signal transduction histidine kinase
VPPNLSRKPPKLFKRAPAHLPLRAYFLSMIALFVVTAGIASAYVALQTGHDAHAERQLLIVLAGLAASMLGAWLVYRSVVAPVRRLSRAVRAAGELGESVPVPEKGPREIAGLAEDVNVLIAWVRHELAERRRAEEQLVQSNKMEAFGQLAGGIAHDFNNLLTAIGGYANLARLKSENPEVIGDLDQVLDAAERAGELTHQLLAFSRRQVLHVQPVDLDQVVRDTERLLRRLIGEDVRIVVSRDGEPATVSADAGQLSQVLVNLALNARDAMPDGGTLTIQMTNTNLDDALAGSFFDAEPGAYVRISVSDTGVGIPEEAKPHLFEPFFTTKEVGKGTGLGLATTYGIVRQFGGYMSVYSEVGAGSVFNVYLPRIVASPPEEPPTPAPPARGTERILLVEDELVVREVITEMLEQQGYTVTGTGDPEEALELAAAGDPYDVLVTDVVMPKLNGHQLAEALTERSPELKVIYVSGYTTAAIVQRGVYTDHVAFLQKPFTIGELGTKVREILDHP